MNFIFYNFIFIGMFLNNRKFLFFDLLQVIAESADAAGSSFVCKFFFGADAAAFYYFPLSPTKAGNECAFFHFFAITWNKWTCCLRIGMRTEAKCSCKAGGFPFGDNAETIIHDTWSGEVHPHSGSVSYNFLS